MKKHTVQRYIPWVILLGISVVCGLLLFFLIGRKQNQISLIKQSPTQAYSVLKQSLVKADVLSQHYAAHKFGADLYTARGLSGIRVCDDAFSYGCYHGFFNKAVAVNGPSIIYKLDNECYKGPMQASCQHGIGHGALEFYGSNERIMDALTICDQLRYINKFGCRAGVFMEYNFKTTATFGRPTPRKGSPQNIQTPCSLLPQKYLADCYFYQPQWWITVYHSDYKTIGQLCQGLQAQELRNECYEGLGNVAGPISGFNLDQAEKKCEQISDLNGQFYCKLSLVGTFSSGLTQKKDAVIRVCSEFAGTQKELCIGRTKVKK